MKLSRFGDKMGCVYAMPTCTEKQVSKDSKSVKYLA